MKQVQYTLRPSHAPRWKPAESFAENLYQPGYAARTGSVFGSVRWVGGLLGAMLSLLWAILSFPFRLIGTVFGLIGRVCGILIGFTIMVVGMALGAGPLFMIGVPMFIIGLLLTLRCLGSR